MCKNKFCFYEMKYTIFIPTITTLHIALDINNRTNISYDSSTQSLVNIRTWSALACCLTAFGVGYGSIKVKSLNETHHSVTNVDKILSSVIDQVKHVIEVVKEHSRRCCDHCIGLICEMKDVIV